MRSFLFLIVWIVSACIVTNSAQAELLSLTGDWNYQDTNNAVDQFSENYSVNLEKNINLTESMSLDTNIRFNRKKDESETKENLSPSASYLINNDLFSFIISGTASEEFKSKSSEKSNRSFAANWNSNWNKEKWTPFLGLNYNKSWQEDDANPRVIDTNTTSTGVNLDWDFVLTKLFYSFNYSENNNDVTGSKGKTNNQLARFETERSFFNDRVSVSFSQNYSSTDAKNILPVSGGTALLQLSVSGFSDEVAVPAAAYSLTTNPDLTDGDTTDNAVTTVNDANLLHIGIRTSSQTVNTLYLYTDSTLALATYSAFSWDLYSSNANATWVLEKSGLTATYNSAQNRFEIDISGYSREYLGVFAATDAEPATSVTFSEIEVYRSITATGNTTLVKTRFNSHKSDLNFLVQVKDNLQLTSNFSYEQNNSSSSPDLNSTRVNAGLYWYPKDDITVRLDGDFSSRKRENALEDQTRSYGLNVSLKPLSTVTTVWGATLTETYQSTTMLTENTNYNIQAVASLYEDLDGRLNASYIHNIDKSTGLNSDITSAQMVLTARLIPSLVADLSANYSKTSGSSASINSTLSMHWRLSEMLSVNGNFSQDWASTDTSSMLVGFDLALTRNMQLSINHSRTFRPNIRHTSTLNWRWTISRYISMLTTGSYQDGNGSEAWSISSRLNARFSLM